MKKIYIIFALAVCSISVLLLGMNKSAKAADGQCSGPPPYDYSCSDCQANSFSCVNQYGCGEGFSGTAGFCIELCHCEQIHYVGNAFSNAVCGPTPPPMCSYYGSFCEWYETPDPQQIFAVGAPYLCGGAGGGGPDFTISSAPLTASINQGQSQAYNVTVQSVNSFSGNVDLTAVGQCPTNATCNYSVSTVNVPSGGSASSIYTVSNTATTPGSTYNITFTGTSGALSHQATSQLIVGVGVNNASCTSLTAPSSVVAGSSFTATAVMYNNGTKPWVAPPPVVDQDYKLGETDGVGWNSLTRVYMPNGTTINPGQSHSFTIPAIAPSNPGTYPFQWQMVEELVMWFGASCFQNITVFAQPDLIADSLTVTGNLTAGSTLSFSGRVNNIGPAAAGASSQTRLRIDQDQNGTWDVNPANQTTGNLAAGGSESENWSSAWTSVPAGNHRMEVCADTTSVIAESNEANNCATYDFTVNSAVPPTGDIDCGSPLGDSCVISYNYNVRVNWSSSNATSCNVTPPNWPGLSGDQNPGPIISSTQTYSLVCSNAGNSNVTVDTVTATVPPPPTNPSYTCGAGGNSATIYWSAPAGYSHFKVRVRTPNESGSIVLNNDDYIGTNATVSITPGVNYRWWVHTRDAVVDAHSSYLGFNDFSCVAPSPPAAPTVSADNTTCSQIRLAWTDNSSDETGFHVWRDTSPGGSPPTISYNSVTYYQIANLAANVISYIDSPAVSTSYRYIVTSYNASGDSTVTGANAVGPIFNNPCTANITLSNKTIDQVNAFPYTTQTLYAGDTITFKIIVNNSGSGTAYDVYAIDTLTPTLVYVPGSVRLNGSAISESISGQNITWNVTQNLGDKANDGLNWVLTFDARLISSSSQAIDFFQNAATINYSNSNGGAQNQILIVQTPLTAFRTGLGRVPTIREVAP